MKRLTLILALFLSYCSCALTQEMSEGKITYSITYLEVPEEVKGFESMLSDEMHMLHKGQKTRVEQEVMGGSQVVVSDEEAGTAFMLMDMMGQRIAVLMSKEELDAANDEESAPEVTYLSGSKVILGYVCKRALIKSSDNTNEVWYTEEINWAHKDYESLTGFPLQYISMQNGMTLEMTATSISEESVPDDLFIIPSGYDPMTMQELQEMGQ